MYYPDKYIVTKLGFFTHKIIGIYDSYEEAEFESKKYKCTIIETFNDFKVRLFRDGIIVIEK